MIDFNHSIDRILPSCHFCLSDMALKLLKSPIRNNSQVFCLEHYYYYPQSLYVISADQAIKPYFRDTLDIHYNYLLLDSKHNNVYCVTSKLGEYILHFQRPVSLNKLNEINISNEEHLYFDKLLEYGFIKEFPVKNECVISFSEVKNDYLIHKIEIQEQLSISDSRIVYRIKYMHKSYILRQLTNMEKKQDFLEEIRILKMLGENLYTPKLIYSNVDLMYYIIEYVEGEVWAQYLKEVVTIKDRILGLTKIIDAMAFLHSHYVVHGDVHACQFVRMLDGNIKVIDFDLVSDLSDDKKSRIRGGALEYLSPEIVNDDPLCVFKDMRMTFQTEVYRMGVLLYYSFYGLPPFYEMTWRQMYKAILQDDLEFPTINKQGDKIPESFVFIMKKCLKRDSKERFSSAVSIKECLNYLY